MLYWVNPHKSLSKWIAFKKNCIASGGGLRHASVCTQENRGINLCKVRKLKGKGKEKERKEERTGREGMEEKRTRNQWKRKGKEKRETKKEERKGKRRKEEREKRKKWGRGNEDERKGGKGLSVACGYDLNKWASLRYRGAIANLASCMHANLYTVAKQCLVHFPDTKWALPTKVVRILTVRHILIG